MVTLADVESTLTLFAEGIAGRYYHIKPSSEFNARDIQLAAGETTLATDTVYVPEALDHPDDAAYRVLVMLQLGQREFGTFRFRMAAARERVPALAGLPVVEPRLRESDYATFFRSVPHPALLKRLLAVCEQVRITARLLARYPGLRAHLARYRAHRHPEPPARTIDDGLGLVEALELVADGVGREGLDDATDLLAAALSGLDRLRQPAADVYDSAALALNVYLALQDLLPPPGTLPGPERLAPEEALEWMQRDDRLEDWEESLARLEQSLAVTLPEGAELAAEESDGLEDAGLRQTDVNLRVLTDERDDLKRRLDMERSALRDALGAVKPDARSYRYDEWNHLEHRYLRHWCRLFEERLETGTDADREALQRVIRQHSAAVMSQLEQIRPLGYQRVRRVADGDELDFNALLDARQDARAGISPDERVYSRKDRVHRDVCAAFLVDLSASTDDPVEPPEPPPPLPEGVEINLRDPYPDLEVVTEPEDQRKIIDVQREAMLVMSAALEKLGDSYGIYGFSGYGRDCVEFYVAKEPVEPFTLRTLEAIAGMKPRRSTRMGPAIRHAVTKLNASGNALKLLIILSDGFPQDSDYGPVRGDHEYGLMDTAKALREAQSKGVEVFCVTVDRSGNDYLKRMCPANR